LIFCTNFVWNLSHYKNNLGRYYRTDMSCV
jgi:hypothetical protein